MTDGFHDALVTQVTADMPERFFDRFMFNLHPDNGTTPSVILGAGIYPPRNVVDGFVVLTTATEQRNLRVSTEHDSTDAASVGPLRWETVEDNVSWRICLGKNKTGLELDLLWHARAPYWLGSVDVTNTDGNLTSFDHLFQPGRYEGTFTLDGTTTDVTGWYGLRDRSRGVRTMSGGQGLHIWYQAQFPDRTFGFLLVEDRRGERILLEGAVMHDDGRIDDITDVRHNLAFTTGNDLVNGTVEIKTADGATYRVDAYASTGGGYMAGGGYGGHHGKVRGRDFEEFDVYPLDGTVGPKTLDSALTDRCCAFEWNGQTGYGIFEFALSRSASYAYRPSLV
ncbi:hypothetical protein L618_002700000280 [Rhodococcus rhodochrous J45]|uniref:Uncharacterized protein n=1 Tax=Rhodococcus rhodochrous J45 TaxID=935266 RepID=A0A562E2S8_RHORH|nr:hypothetical protein [Rhodococcus rhodochrous]TWH16249.1 hypothetical protein L618_002700000280 [Rhodococcus rhodochrous J45]